MRKASVLENCSWFFIFGQIGMNISILIIISDRSTIVGCRADEQHMINNSIFGLTRRPSTDSSEMKREAEMWRKTSSSLSLSSTDSYRDTWQDDRRIGWQWYCIEHDVNMYTFVFRWQCSLINTKGRENCRVLVPMWFVSSSWSSGIPVNDEWMS